MALEDTGSSSCRQLVARPRPFSTRKTGRKALPEYRADTPITTGMSVPDQQGATCRAAFAVASSAAVLAFNSALTRSL